MNASELSSVIRLGLIGYGAMGREIERLAPSNGCQVVAVYSASNPFDPAIPPPFDVAIEFTTPASAVGNILAVVAADRPVVSGTTGWYDRIEEVERLVAAQNGRALYGSNFSIGVNMFFRIVREAARLVNAQPDYDIAIRETHHVRKSDAPSGTALALAQIVLEEVGRKREITTTLPSGTVDPVNLLVAATRIGSVPGTHEVILDAEADSIELVHRARGRSGFAIGALSAARWIISAPPGLHRFDEILA